MVNFKAMIYVDDLNADAEILISFNNISKPESDHSMNIHDVIKKAKQWTPIFFSVPVPDKNIKDNFLKCFLRNLGNYPGYIDEMEVEIVTYEKQIELFK